MTNSGAMMSNWAQTRRRADDRLQPGLHSQEGDDSNQDAEENLSREGLREVLPIAEER